jgi:tight adherence protein B
MPAISPSTSSLRRTAQSLRFLCALFVGLLVPASLLGLSSATAATAQNPSESEPALNPTLIVALDTSPRITPGRFADGIAAVETVLNSVPTADVALVGFGGTAGVLSPLAPVATTKQALANVQQVLADFGGENIESQLTQGVALSVETLGGATGPKAILVVTDGTNSGSAVPVEQARQSAISKNVSIGIIDLRNAGDESAAKAALISELRGVKGEAIRPDDPAGLTRLGASLFVARVTPTELALTPDEGLVSKIFGNTITLALAALLIGGAIFFVAFQVMGPKEVKVNLTGIPEPKKQKQEVKTPVAGIALKISEMADKKLEKSGKARGMQSWLERGAINLRSGEFLTLVLFVTLASAAVVYLLRGLVFSLAALILGPFVGRAYVNRRANQRSRKFGDQLSDTLQLISSSMRAGQGFMQALDAVARESDSPTSEEFNRVVLETRLGRDLVDAIKGMAERIRCEDLEWVIPAVEINREVGGDLAEVLEQVGATIRDRADLRRQVKTLSAEGRLSAIVLIGLPITLGGFIRMSNPEYMAGLFSGIGLYFLGAAAVMMLIGSIWLFNLCKIEF